MPVTYLDVPEGIGVNEKTKLMKSIYEALHEAYPFPDDVRIFLREWPLESVSQDGRLGSEPARPVFMMHVPQGVNVDAKRKMAKKINDAVAEAYHLPKFMVFMHEYPLDLVALDGGFQSDNKARVEAQGKVYAGLQARSKMKEVIVVTGATGRVGRPLAERLVAAGRAVRAVARDAEKLKPLAALGAEVLKGSLHDPVFLTEAFQGANATFVLTALDVKAPEVNIDQYKKAESIATAIRAARVNYVVFLSSWGADVPEKSGGVLGCRRLEQLLDETPGLNVVHLRPVWFMENFLWNIGLIKMAGINGLAIRPESPFSMIASRDIAPIAADYLVHLDFKGRNVRYLRGARDYTMTEVTRILGAAVGKPELKYVEFPDAIFRKGLISAGGLSPHAADMALEINRGIDSGLINAEPRSQSNTTPTTLEEFARTTFAPAFNSAPNASFSEKFGGMFLRTYLSLMGRRAA